MEKEDYFLLKITHLKEGDIFRFNGESSKKIYDKKVGETHYYHDIETGNNETYSHDEEKVVYYKNK